MKVTLHPPRKKVNKNQRFEGTHLVPLLLKRKGEVDAFFYVPACAQCGQPILDFSNANISVCGWDHNSKPVKLASFDDADFFVLKSDGAYVFCKSCDDRENKPWVGADSVFSSDQRSRIEKVRL